MLEFDSRKDAANIRKHGISLARFDDMELDTALSMRDARHSGEDRWIILGYVDDVLHCAAITYRNGNTRAISLRRASRRERRQYGET